MQTSRLEWFAFFFHTFFYFAYNESTRKNWRRIDVKYLVELLSTPFVKGALCGGILILLLFVSWRFVLLAAGVLALYYLLKCRR